MLIKQKVNYVVSLIRRFPSRYILPVVGFVIALAYFLAFIVERPVQFSYAGTTCFGRLTLFPDLQKQTGTSSSYKLTHQHAIKVGSVPILSTQDCVATVSAPKQGIAKISSSPFGGILFKKTFAITAETAPVPNVDIFAKPIPTAKPLEIPFNKADTINEYSIQIGDRRTDCRMQGKVLVCDIVSLDLEQGKEYQVSLERSFKGMAKTTLFQKNITTLSATNVVTSSVSSGQTIYDRPTALEISFDKGIISTDMKLVNKDTNSTVAFTKAVEGNSLKIRLEKEFDRNAHYLLTLDKLEAQDGSTLEIPYVADFFVSGGPKIAGTNIGSSRAGVNQTVILTFDQPLLDKQDISQLVSSKGIDGTFAKQGNQILFTYSNAPKCTDFTITIAKGLQSSYEIAQSDQQSFSSRTICYTTETIGYSVRGRAINAYIFGNGTTSYLFTGAIHGNELSSNYTMRNWMDDLEAHPGKIPANARVIVVPSVNPDGVASGNRLNAHSVNLNRNFPTSNWTSNIVTGGGEQAGGGGSSAGSEPETQALMSLTRRYAPHFVVTHHSSGALVNSNDVGVSIAAGQRYASLARYSFVPNSATTGTFGFEMTGTYEDWLLERGTAAILVELDTDTGNHFARNQNALWAMLSY